MKITRKAGEALLPDCVEPKVQRKIGWMFWGSISGQFGKGPGLFWEKNWGTITSASYCEHVLPVVEQYARGRLYFMQDNAAAHGARATRAEIQRRGLHMIFWPALSPDLNPIETVWDWMKDSIQAQGTEIYRNYPRLRAEVIRAWNQVTDEQVIELIKSMPARCEAVIEARGWHTKY